jgi:hypothetical protein
MFLVVNNFFDDSAWFYPPSSANKNGGLKINLRDIKTKKY